MKKQLFLSVIIIASFTTQTKAQVVIDTVTIGAGYANQKWYSLENDEQGTAQAKDNWDIAFEITGYSASIMANTQKANFIVYKAPYKIADYGIMDTSGINNWQKLYNSDSSWSIGAFNKGGVFSNPNYLGWGLYDVNTHIVSGDSCYVIKLSASSYKKFKINHLSNGAYNFEYADLNGSNSQNVSLQKSAYSNRNFAYYDLSNNSALDREPANSNWDLTFVRYTAMIPTPYAVVGVLQNKGVRCAQADDVTSPATYTDWGQHSFNGAINIIGYDWKTFDLAVNAWRLVTDTVYFVESKQGDIWKLMFTGFGGSANGNFILSKEKLSAAGIKDETKNTGLKFSVYPNPLAGEELNLVFTATADNSPVAVEIKDVNGKTLIHQAFSIHEGISSQKVNTHMLSAGLYFVSISLNGKTATQKFIKQ